MSFDPGRRQSSMGSDVMHDQVPVQTGTQDIISTIQRSASGTFLPAPQNVATKGQTAPSRVRRRNRMITSCLECRRRKLKCDKSQPCLNCTRAARECVFLSKEMDPASQLKLAEIKEKVGSLERLLERDVAKPVPVATYGLQRKDRYFVEEDEADTPEDEKFLEPTPLAMAETVYEENDEADDDILDLGVAIGRMRITERIGGSVRPKLSQELNRALQEQPDEAFDLEHDQMLRNSSNYDFIRPGSSYIAPASGFFFGHSSHSAPGLIDFLPSRIAADRLIRQYFAAVHPIARTVHKPTFDREYETFWDEVALGIEPVPSQQTLVFAAMFSGAVSMDELVIARDFGVTKQSLIDNFKLGCETALGRASFLRTTKVSVLQGFVMYLIPLCRAEVSRAHSVLVGAAIRMAECMGLHRDGESFGLNPVETHIRRLIWHQLCFLDIRTCEAQGPRPSIRADDFDTKLPVNADDADIHAQGPPPTDNDRWTDMTYSLMRFTATEMFRTIWVDRPRVAARQMTLTALLAKIEAFKTRIAQKFDHLLDSRVALQRSALIVKALLLSRLSVATLHVYHNSVVSLMPPRLRNLIVKSCIVSMETGIALETAPDLSLWNWYVGAYTQHHSALLLLVDIFAYEKHPDMDRIWPCLDYIFQTDASRPREEKARAILADARQKIGVYAERRKLRTPMNMVKFVTKPGSTLKAVPRVSFSAQSMPQTLSSDGLMPDQQENGSHAFANQGTSTMRVSTSSSPSSLAQNKQSLPASYTPQMPSTDALYSQHDMVAPGYDEMAASPQAQIAPNSDANNMTTFDSLMADIDWDAFNALFPTDESMGDFTMPGFTPFVAGPYTYSSNTGY